MSKSGKNSGVFTFILFVVSLVSGESVGLRALFVSFTPPYGKEQTGKQVAFLGTLSTNHVI